MAYIPVPVRATRMIQRMVAAGLSHLNSGKTGEMFDLPDKEVLLMVRTDRISIFDFVLNAIVELKGTVLTAMTVVWLTEILDDVLKQFGGHHLVAYGPDIDRYLPKELRGDSDLQMRTIVVKKLSPTDHEDIPRQCLTGTALQAYRETGEVCGHILPEGLHDGSWLSPAIFTVTTKADEGHDEHMNYRSIRDKYGMVPENLSMAVFNRAQQHANERGIIVADTKFEISGNVLMDEVLTPDSSRYWLKSEWEEGQKNNPPKAPGGFDKDGVRRFGKTIETPFQNKRGEQIIGINKLNPEDEDHVRFVSKLSIPEKLLDDTSMTYQDIFYTISGRSLLDFWKSTGVR